MRQQLGQFLFLHFAFSGDVTAPAGGGGAFFGGIVSGDGGGGDDDVGDCTGGGGGGGDDGGVALTGGGGGDAVQMGWQDAQSTWQVLGQDEGQYRSLW